jgi:ABC-type nitrate/sulfonate/bicarbonate transport system substrate-binding protein
VGVTRTPLYLVTTGDVSTIAELRGHRIGLEAGRHAMGVLRELLARGGLTLGDVSLSLLDAESADLVLEQGQVDAALVYAPFSQEMAKAGARTLARWDPPAEGELQVLVTSARAHRVAAGQIDHLAAAWLFGARALQAPDSAVTALVARREDVAPAEVAGLLATQHYLGDRDDRWLREREGARALETALATIASRWRELGVPDSLPPRGRWLSQARRPS